MAEKTEEVKSEQEVMTEIMNKHIQSNQEIKEDEETGEPEQEAEQEEGEDPEQEEPEVINEQPKRGRAQKRIESLLKKNKEYEKELERLKIESEFYKNLQEKKDVVETKETEDDEESLDDILNNLQEEDAALMRKMLKLQEKEIMSKLTPVISQAEKAKTDRYVSELEVKMRDFGDEMDDVWRKDIANKLTNDEYISNLAEVDPERALFLAYQSASFDRIKSNKKVSSKSVIKEPIAPTWTRPSEQISQNYPKEIAIENESNEAFMEKIMLENMRKLGKKI